MWTLVRLTLRYHKAVLAISMAIAAVVGVLVATLVALGGTVEVLGEDSLSMTQPFVAGEVAAQGMLFAAMIATFIIGGIEREEKRLLLLGSLPVPRRQMALARAALPVVTVLLGLVVGAVVLAFTSLLIPVALTGKRALVSIFITGQLLFFAQLPLAAREVSERRQSGRLGQAWTIGAILVLLLSLAAVGVLGVAAIWARLAVVWAVAAALLVANVLLFERRRSFKP